MPFLRISKCSESRLALLDPTPARIVLANKVLDRGTAWRGKSDIWFSPRGLAADGGTVAFVFPGVEAAFAANIDDVAGSLGISTPTDITAATLPTFAAWRANVAEHRATLHTLLEPGDIADFVRATEILEGFWQDGTLGYGIACAAKG